ncbi:ankyrin repeat-containing domain protein [Globomyces pollinis-pini]|nr:ankyrin repeat-containing domain protein [Globomyces pollinis-pini]
MGESFSPAESQKGNPDTTNKTVTLLDSLLAQRGNRSISKFLDFKPKRINRREDKSISGTVENINPKLNKPKEGPLNKQPKNEDCTPLDTSENETNEICLNNGTKKTVLINQYLQDIQNRKQMAPKKARASLASVFEPQQYKSNQLQKVHDEEDQETKTLQLEKQKRRPGLQSDAHKTQTTDGKTDGEVEIPLFRAPVQHFMVQAEEKTIEFMQYIYYDKPSEEKEVEEKNEIDQPIPEKLIEEPDLHRKRTIPHKTIPTEDDATIEQYRSLLVKNADQENLISTYSKKLDLMSETLKQRLFEKAVQTSNLEVAFFLLKDGTISPHGENQLAILMACQMGDLDFAKALLAYPQVDPTLNQNQCLRLACLQGHLDIVKCLLDDKRVDAGSAGNEALKNACKHGHFYICELLLKSKNVDPTSNAMSKSPLTISCENNNIKIFQLLLDDNRVDPSESNQLPLITAVTKGREKMVQLLLSDSRVDPSVQQNICIKRACQNGFESIVKLLLSDKRVDPTDNQNEALLLACQNNRENIILELLKIPSVNPSSKDNECLIQICTHGNLKVYNALIADSRVNPASQNNKCIQVATENGHSHIIKVLLKDSRVNPNCMENFPIRKACVLGDEGIVRMLLQDPRVDPAVDRGICIKLARSAPNGASIVKLLYADPRIPHNLKK